MQRALTALICLMLPSKLAVLLLNLLGHKIGTKANIGFSLIVVEKLYLADDVRIGHLNLILVRRLVLRRGARIGRLNGLKGPMTIFLAERAALGNQNIVVRGKWGSLVKYPASLKLGLLTKITSGHYIDITSSVAFGDYSILAGRGSQVWTHGYVHEDKGPGRYRVDGEVKVGSNCYIGSASIINAGVNLGSGVIVGSGTTISKSLLEPGMYVSSPVRSLQRPIDPEAREELELVPGLVERVYRRRRVR